MTGRSVISDPVTDFPGQIQTFSVLLKKFYNADTLFKMSKTKRADLI